MDTIAATEPVSQLSVIERVANAVERQLDLIEAILAGSATPEERTEAERCGRMLASLAHTLAELKKLRGDEQGSATDDDRPRDLEELRRRLCERLEAKFTGTLAFSPGGDVTKRDRLSE